MIMIMKKTHIKKLVLTLFSLFAFSCSSDLDFNQANELLLEPVIVANLTYFDIAAPQFVTNGVENNLLFDAQDFDVFRDSFFRDNLKRADFYFEISNTISRAYTINILLLDKNDQILYTIPMTVPAYTGSENIVKITEKFENNKLTLLKSTKRMAFMLTMAPGTPLTANSLGNLKLKSSATVYLEIK